LAARLPLAESVLVKSAGHAAHLERPDDVLDLARRFFRDVDSGRHADLDTRFDNDAKISNPPARKSVHTVRNVTP